MKKWIAIIVMSLCSLVPARAQHWGPYSVHKAPISENLVRYVARALGFKDVEWVKRVHHEETHLVPSGPLASSFYTISTRDFLQRPIQKDEKLFHERFASVQKAITKNPALKRYTLVVPIPLDLTMTPGQDINYMLHFLAQPTDEDHFNKIYTPYSVKQAERGVTEVKLKSNNQNLLILRIDSLKKKVYFFLNEY